MRRPGCTEIVTGVDSGERYAKFAGRHDLALAIVVLSVEPNLLYLLGEPKDPAQAGRLSVINS